MTYSRRRGRLFSVVSPAVTCSLIIVVLMVGGILSVLPVTVMLLQALGVLLFAFQGYQALLELCKGKAKWEALYALAAATIFAGGCALICRLFSAEGSTLYHYDNFSHWGLIVKYLLKNDAFPTPAANDLISFTSYPVGSACFIYYFCLIVGSEATATLLTAQTLLLFSGYFSLLMGVQEMIGDSGFIRRFRLSRSEKAGSFNPRPQGEGKWTRRLCAAVDFVLRWPILECAAGLLMIVFLCTYNTDLNNLLVDNLLSALGLALFLICVHNAEDIKRAFSEIALLMGALVTIKNSGLFIALFALCYCANAACVNCRSAEERHFMNTHGALIHQSFPWKRFCRMALVPLAMLLIWKVHCIGFGASKHAMSLTAYIEKLTNDDSAASAGIKAIILPRIFSLSSNQAILPTLSFLVVAALIVLSKSKSDFVFEYGMFVFCSFLIYELGTLMMYLFSMDYSEVAAQNGNDYLRYNGTIVAIIGGCVFDIALRFRQHVHPHSFAVREGSGIAVMLVSVILVCVTLAPSHTPFQSREQVEKDYPDLMLLERLAQQVEFTGEDRVIFHCRKDYGIPQNGVNYYAYPCTDYRVVFSDQELTWLLSERDDYTCIVDLTGDAYQLQWL